MGHDTTSQDLRSLRMPMVGTLGVAFLALVAVVLMFNRSDDRDTEVATGPGTTTVGATDDPDADQPDDGHTGFYVPGELPEGWTVRFVEGTNSWPEQCPCESSEWRKGDDASISSFVSAAQEPVSTPDHPPSMGRSEYREIPGGFVGTDTERGEVRANWFDGEATRSLFAKGVDVTTVEDLARSWTGDAILDPPDGFEHMWTGTMPDIERRTELYWTITDPVGRSMVVHVEPWMYDEPYEPSAMWPGVEPIVLPSNGLSVGQVPEWTEPHMEGMWPGGAYVTVAESYGEFNYTGPYLTADEMIEVAGGFRPVSAQEWAAYVAEQFHPDRADTFEDDEELEESIRVLTKPRLADLLVMADESGAEGGPEANGEGGSVPVTRPSVVELPERLDSAPPPPRSLSGN